MTLLLLTHRGRSTIQMQLPHGYDAGHVGAGIAPVHALPPTTMLRLERDSWLPVK